MKVDVDKKSRGRTAIAFSISSLAGVLAIVVCVVLSPFNAAQANDEFDTWQNTLAPLYIWGMSFHGDAAFGPADVPIEIEFKDAVKDLTGIFTLHYEGTKGHWGIIADYSYIKLSPKAEIGPVGIDVDMANTIAELDGLYRFGPDNPWQLLFGYRSYELDLEAKTAGGTPLVSKKATLNDFIIGGRFVNQFAGKWSFLGRLDVGTGDSDRVWNAVLSFDYRFTKLLSGFAGYRWLDYNVDKSNGNKAFEYNVTTSGPLLALVFHW